MSYGLKPADAVHVAAAEQLEADVLLTTDDRLTRAGKRLADRLKTRIMNVLSFQEELSDADDR